PGSLDLLKNSFLNSYLPAENGGATQIEEGSLDVLSAQWGAKNTSLVGGLLKATQPWSGIRLKLRPESKFVPNTAELLADRRIGRGRIVVTAFRLDLPDFIHWKAVHGFYNSCLMLRPHRKWTYANFAQLNWADIPERRFDAQLTCGLRFFSRDAGLRTNFKKITRKAGDEGVWAPGLLARRGFDEAPAEEWVPPEEAPGGVAAWNDFNASANAARESLRIAAGVTVPKAGFILGVLAVYLIFLVPINGMFFHAIGRVEWAWIAAPLIALAGTMVVVWQAQLDIGFVRARTDVAIIETHGSHPRAHVTRFTALYTSLGTTYEFQSDNPTSLIQPFPVKADYELIQNQAFSDVVFRKHQDVRLTGFNVSSNTTNMVRSEQIVDLEGMIRLGTNSLGHPLLINGSQWDMADVAIVQRPNDSKKLLGCWVGRLKAGVSSTIRLEPLSAAPPFVKERKEEARSRPVEDIHMDSLIQLALDTATIDPGEIRMVGRVEGILPGIKITPDASQVRGAALIVSHLKPGNLRPPKPDINYRVDVDRLAPQDGGGE
ncbi:MAG: hypothetical protein JW829_16760, partial [Pirellulales bacterium]|nr:hypothetical protein [Pirellulales bacterium]